MVFSLTVSFFKLLLFLVVLFVVVVTVIPRLEQKIIWPYIIFIE